MITNIRLLLQLFKCAIELAILRVDNFLLRIENNWLRLQIWFRTGKWPDEE